MTKRIPWSGARRPLSPGAFAWAANALGCEDAAIRAVWEVEASGRFYDDSGGVLHRFEPHKMPGSTMTWRESLALDDDDDKNRREALFREAWAEAPNAALRACSWGAPQIMGFNAEAAGFASAREMVEAMADAEDAHLEAFVRLNLSKNLATKLRAHDWLGYAEVYNGEGQPAVYARRMESAYRRHSGQKSPMVLKVGARGEAVKRLQRALGIEDDGAFGPETDAAVRSFQADRGLVVDGIVGALTWAAIEERGAEFSKAPAQEDSTDKLIERAQKATGVASGASAAASPILDRLNENMLAIVLVFAGVAGLMALGFWFWRRSRKER